MAKENNENLLKLNSLFDINNYYVMKPQIINDIVMQYLENKYNIYISRFELTGDKELTKNKQELLFTTMFNYGRAAVVKYGGEKEILLPFILNFKLDGSPIVSGFTLAQFNTNETSELHVLKTANKENAVFLYAKTFTNAIAKSYLNKLLPFTSILASIIYQFTQAVDSATIKVIMDDADTRKKFAEDLFNPSKRILSYKKDENNKETKPFGDNDAETSAKKLNLESNISDLTNAIDDFIRFSDSILGDRNESNFKKAKKIGQEVKNSILQYKLAEKNQKRILEKFVDDYKLKFGIQLEIIDNLAEAEQEEQSLANPNVEVGNEGNDDVEPKEGDNGDK